MDTDVIARHTRTLERRGDRPISIKHRRDVLRRLSAHLTMPLLEATFDDLLAWQDRLTVCASSVATYTAHVHAFYAWALDEEWVAVDPARRLPMPKVRRRMSQPIPEGDLSDALVTARHDPPLHCWLVLAAFAGLRAGEIAAIAQDDVETADGGAGWLTVHGKGGKDRVVRLAPDVMAVLTPHFVSRGPVFRRPSGAPMTGNEVTRRSSEHLHGIGLPYTLHKLRHRWAGRMVDLGADLRDVQEGLGHASLATTSLYVRSSARRSAKSVDRLSKDLRCAGVTRVRKPPARGGT